MQKTFTLKMDRDEADALMQVMIRGLETVSRSSPAELRLIEKMTELGEMLEDEA